MPNISSVRAADCFAVALELRKSLTVDAKVDPRILSLVRDSPLHIAAAGPLLFLGLEKIRQYSAQRNDADAADEFVYWLLESVDNLDESRAQDHFRTLCRKNKISDDEITVLGESLLTLLLGGK